MPLSAFPKTFGLRELKKGFFPHLFNTPANQEYVGPLPAAEYYMPEGMKVDIRQEFDTWYAKQVAHQASTGELFHSQHKLKAYCRADVSLLKEFQSHAAFDPFKQMTVAWLAISISVCIASLQTPLRPNPSWGGEAVSTVLRSPWNG